MERTLLNSLIVWAKKQSRLPLLLRGARQVGKTHLVRQLAESHFEYAVEINFELHPEFCACFSKLDPFIILKEIKLLTEEVIVPGKTLLFLDEIQECPQAIMALRYFKEKLPLLHVIGAGSLLEFTLNEDNFRMPVGRVQFMYLKPMSFREFLVAHDYGELNHYLSEININEKISLSVHVKLLDLLRLYFVIGGMPAANVAYKETQEFDDVQTIQTALLSTYRRDFGKYASTGMHKFLEQVFHRAPAILGQQVKYVDLSQDMRSRELKKAIGLLQQAGIIYQVLSSHASSLPLNSVINPKKFKFVYLDIGLAIRQQKTPLSMILEEDVLLNNRGALAEQFVGQELLAYQKSDEEPELFYWAREKRGSVAEVDYVVPIEGRVVPVEVKAGASSRFKSLYLFLDEKKLNTGLCFSPQVLCQEDRLIKIPFYLISEYERLLRVVRTS